MPAAVAELSVQTELSPGDRVEAWPVAERDQLRPSVAWTESGPASTLLLPGGRSVPIAPNSSNIAVPGLGGMLAAGWSTLWLEFVGDATWRLVVEQAARPFKADLTTSQGVPVHVDIDDAVWRSIPERPASLDEMDLAIRAGRLATFAGFDQLICLPMVRDMEILEHQVRTAKTVLRRFRGRALLCDEVGLGKTIEAGLILDELHLRGLAKSILVLTPPSLIEQWQGEMRRKFGIDFIGHDHPDFKAAGADAWSTFDHVIASYHTAKREPHRSAILNRKWDLLVVDEAHHLRNRATQLWKFASELKKQYVLLLTATPVQNNLDELFNLVTLLEPGLLSTAKQFQKQFVDKKDKLSPKNVDQLHTLLSEVMVRNRRGTVGLQFTRRWARTERVPQTEAERSLYSDSAELVRSNLRSSTGKDAVKGSAKGPLSRMALLSLQMALGSSSQAAAGTLERLAESDSLDDAVKTRIAELASRARSLHDASKVGRLLQLVREFGDKMVVFTQFRATLDMLAAALADAGIPTAVFHGGLSRMEKERAIESFRGDAQVLLCTEAGSEGRNLQFAHAVCNFDLPWNPMKIEQRIGRLSRIGQTRDVHVFNLVAAGTVEASVLHLLEAKLNLFEMVIGEIDMVLGNLDDEREFQDVVVDLWAESEGQDDFARRMDELGNRLVQAKDAYLEQKAVDERLFANRFAPDQ